MENNNAGQIRLCNHLKETHKLKNDAALSRLLQVAPPVISNLRKGKLSAGPSFILRVHEFAGMAVKDIRSFLEG